MQISKKRMSPMLMKQISSMWFQLISDIKTPEEAEKILTDLLSETEATVIAKRLAVGYYLSKGRSYENVRQNLKVSSATIATINEALPSNGWKLALQKVMAEEWATKWEEKIKNVFKKNS